MFWYTSTGFYCSQLMKNCSKSCPRLRTNDRPLDCFSMINGDSTQCNWAKYLPFGISTYARTEKRLIGVSHNVRTINTLITSKYVSLMHVNNCMRLPSFLLLCLCASVSVDLRIRRIKTVYHTHMRARMAARLDHVEC